MPQQKGLQDRQYFSGSPKETTLNDCQACPCQRTNKVSPSSSIAIRPIAKDETVFMEIERQAPEFIQEPKVHEVQELLRTGANQSGHKIVGSDSPTRAQGDP